MKQEIKESILISLFLSLKLLIFFKYLIANLEYDINDVKNWV